MKAVLLDEKLKYALETLRIITSDEEKFALINYIACLNEAIAQVEKKEKQLGLVNQKNIHLYNKKSREYNKLFRKKFVFYKSFHELYIGDILEMTERDCKQMKLIHSSIEERTFSRKDFFDVLFLYLKEINQEKLFKRLYRKNCIYPVTDKDESGYTLYNPLTKDIDLFISGFRYDVYHMQVLLHELGHAYDLAHFKGTAKNFNEFFYLSSYTELYSLLLERNFLHFLLKNNIKETEAKYQLIRYESISRTILLGCYAMSVLKEETLLKEDAPNFIKEIPIEEVTPYFKNKKDIKKVIHTLQELSLSEIYNYTYGDILSLFFCEEMEKSGLSNELINAFLNRKRPLFSEEFFYENDFTAEKYAKIYKKEIQLVKK